jgi:hypothetical protein
MVLAADRRQARTVFRYIAGLLEGVPMLERLIEGQTSDAIHLANRISIEVHTASFRAVRGYTLVAAVCDEVAFWRDESSANPDAEILAALRPGMATVRGAVLLGISSPSTSPTHSLAPRRPPRSAILKHLAAPNPHGPERSSSRWLARGVAEPGRSLEGKAAHGGVVQVQAPANRVSRVLEVLQAGDLPKQFDHRGGRLDREFPAPEARQRHLVAAHTFRERHSIEIEIELDSRHLKLEVVGVLDAQPDTDLLLEQPTAGGRDSGDVDLRGRGPPREPWCTPSGNRA